MPVRKEQFVNGEFYHIYLRRPDGESLFRSNRDRLRFLLSALIAHCVASRPSSYNIQRWTNTQIVDVLNDKREALSNYWDLHVHPRVAIVAFALLNNHFHFLLQQKVEDGIQEFMQRLSTGYVKYFNKKYQRKGPLFESRFNAIPIGNDERYLRYLFGYIHLNALDAKDIEWRRMRLRDDWKEITMVLEDYPWTSFNYYMEKGTNEFAARY